LSANSLCRRPHSLGFFLLRGLLPRVLASHCVLLEPGELYVHLEELVAQLLPAMWLAWSDVQVSRYAVALERAVHLDRLWHGHSNVFFTDQENRRRLHVRDVLQR